MSRYEKRISYLIVAVATSFNIVSLGLFMVFLFVGPLEIVVFDLSEPSLLTFNTLHLLLFFIHHSLMLRRTSIRWMAKFVSPYYQTPLFAVTAASLLLSLVILWQPSDEYVLEIGNNFRWIFRTLYMLALGMMIWVGIALKDSLFVRMDPNRARLRGITPDKKSFTISGPYRWVRHPAYFATLLAIWSNPDITTDRLLFNVLATVWVIIGTKLEERDMVFSIGESYQTYQRQVPMLIPRHIRPVVG